MYYLLYSLPDV